MNKLECSRRQVSSGGLREDQSPMGPIPIELASAMKMRDYINVEECYRVE